MITNEQINILIERIEKNEQIAISNNIKMDEDVESLLNYENVNNDDLFLFLLNSVNYFNETNEKIKNGELEDEPKLFVEKSPIYKLKKAKKLLKNNENLNSQERYQNLRIMFLKVMFSLYLINLHIKYEMFKEISEKDENDIEKPQEYLDKAFKSKLKEFKKNKQLETVYIFNLIRNFKTGLLFLQYKNFKDYDEAIDHFISMINFFLDNPEVTNEHNSLLEDFNFILNNFNPEEKEGFIAVSAILTDMLGFVLNLSLLDEEQIDQLLLIKKTN